MSDTKLEMAKRIIMLCKFLGEPAPSTTKGLAMWPLWNLEQILARLEPQVEKRKADLERWHAKQVAEKVPSNLVVLGIGIAGHDCGGGRRVVRSARGLS